MFGVAFASMAFMSFLFSPFWGRMCNHYSLGTLLLITCVGYSIGQLFFLIATNEVMIVFARCFSGIFAGGVGVIGLVYVVNDSPPEQKNKYLALLSTFSAAFGAFGFLVGGLLGEISIPVAFIAQSVLVSLAGLLFFLQVRGQNRSAQENRLTVRELVKEANPFSSFLSIRPYLSASLSVLFIALLFAFIGQNAFEQSFNYYIKDQFNFSPAYNGALKALVGVVYLAANFTICMRILKKTKVKLPTALVLLSCSAMTVVMVLMRTLAAFLLVNIGVFALNAVFQPLLQGLVSRKVTSKSSGIVMGFFSAVRFFAMILGALIAGFTYAIGPKMPFWISAAAFFISAAFAFVYCTMDKREVEAVYKNRKAVQSTAFLCKKG